MAICMFVCLLTKNYLSLNLGWGVVKGEYILDTQQLSQLYLLREMKQQFISTSNMTLPNHCFLKRFTLLHPQPHSFEKINHITHVFSSSYNRRNVPAPGRASFSLGSGPHPFLLSQGLHSLSYQFFLLHEVISNTHH